MEQLVKQLIKVKIVEIFKEYKESKKKKNLKV